MSKYNDGLPGIEFDGIWRKVGSRIEETSTSYWPAIDKEYLFYEEDKNIYFRGAFDGEAIVGRSGIVHDLAWCWCTEKAPGDN